MSTYRCGDNCDEFDENLGDGLSSAPILIATDPRDPDNLQVHMLLSRHAHLRHESPGDRFQSV